MRRFDWWEDLRVRHEVLVGAFCVRFSIEHRRTGDSHEEVLRHAEALERELPQEARELLANPDADADLGRERAEQRGWLLRWRSVPEEDLGEVKARVPTELGFGKLAALRTDRAMLSAASMPMRLMGVVGQAELQKPHHFATSGFAQREHFVLSQHGRIFVLDERGGVVVDTFDMLQWGLPPYRLVPLALDGGDLVVELIDPEPEDRHPELLDLLGSRCRLRLDFSEGWVGRGRPEHQAQGGAD